MHADLLNLFKIKFSQNSNFNKYDDDHYSYTYFLYYNILLLNP